MYELYDACTLMFFYRFVEDMPFVPCKSLISPRRNKHIMIDLGTGNNNKMLVICIELVS